MILENMCVCSKIGQLTLYLISRDRMFAIAIARLAYAGRKLSCHQEEVIHKDTISPPLLGMMLKWKRIPVGVVRHHSMLISCRLQCAAQNSMAPALS
jgi:hypothetical protein